MKDQLLLYNLKNLIKRSSMMAKYSHDYFVFEFVCTKKVGLRIAFPMLNPKERYKNFLKLYIYTSWSRSYYLTSKICFPFLED